MPRNFQHVAGMTTSSAELRASLERHNDIFESLLKLIPAKHYLVRDPDGEEASLFLLSFEYTHIANACVIAPRLVRVKISEKFEEAKGSKTSYQRGHEEGQAGQSRLRPRVLDVSLTRVVLEA